jgi:hypothetical protein
MTSISSAPTFFMSLGMMMVDVWMKTPTINPPDEGAVGGSQSAEGHRGEHEQQDPEPHLPVHGLGRCEQDTADRGQRAAGDPDPHDHSLDVDARRGGEIAVVGDGPHRLADAGERERRGDEHQDRHGDHHDHEVAGRDGEPPEVDATLDLEVAVEAVPAAEDVQDDVAEEDREPDRHDEHRHQAGSTAAERPPDTLVEQAAGDATEHGRQQRGQHERRLPSEHARDVEQVRHHRPERDHLAVCEVRQAGRAVDQRQPDSRHRDQQPELEAVDGELDDADRSPRRRRSRCVPHREQVRPAVPRVHGERQWVVVGVAQRDPLGQRLLDEQGAVLACAGEVETPVPLGVGGRGSDLGPVGRRHDELDTFEEDVLAVVPRRPQRASHLGRRGFGVAVGLVLGVRRPGETEQRTDRYRSGEAQTSGSWSSLPRTWRSARRRHRAETLAPSAAQLALGGVNAR